MEIVTGFVSIQMILLANNNWDNFVKLNGNRIRDVVFDNIGKILSCRKSLGFHLYICNKCNKIEKVMHSCKSRICSSCGKALQDNWLRKTLSSLLPVEYQHIVFTVPYQLRKLFLTHRKDMMSILFKSAAYSVINVVQREYKFKPGILVVCHSFGNDLKTNFHMHVIVTCGGLSTIANKWIKCTFIPEKLLKAEFKILMLRSLRELHKNNRFKFKGKNKKFLIYSYFNKFLDFLYHIKWYVFIGRSLKDASFAVKYVTRYTKKPVIATSRIKSFTNNQVTFEYTDHATNSKGKITLPALDFIAQFVKHIPERYFHQMRYYGIFANKIKNKSINTALTLLGKKLPFFQPPLPFKLRFKNAFGFDRLFCKKCNVDMELNMIAYPKKYGDYNYVFL